MLKKNRAIVVASGFLLIFCLLLARLVQIQLVSTESYSNHQINLIEESVNQRVQSIALDDGRGKFYDQSGEPIDHEQVATLILFPFLDNMKWPIEKLADIIGVSSSEIKTTLANAKEPFVFERNNKAIVLSERQMEDINELKIPGVFATNRILPLKKHLAEQLIGGLTRSADIKKKRYGDRQLPAMTMVGDKGLQEQLDAYLLSEGESRLVYHVDGIGGPLFGINVKYLSPGNELYPVRVITTLDKKLQQAAEDIVDSSEYGIKKGGFIIIDIESSEIRASVSRPSIDQKDPNKGVGAKNLMLTQATLGSVFKTIVSAAAIEEQMVNPNTSYNCNRQFDGTLNTNRPLGYLNFYDSFSQSCNKTFSDLAINLSNKDPDLLEAYAKKLQLVGKSGWSGDIFHSSVTQLFGEENGQIWLKDSEDKKDARLIAQTAIGQQNVQATPLAVANMMATIARNGEKKLVKAVSSIEYANGTTAAVFKNQDIKGDTIILLQQLKN
ncbi:MULTISPECIES: penicillin-binding transpeptidase domain-containing protein [Bacillus]|uniref:penicillin-binding transpeptidase domain-containing protein n=1 Tax=Bacillus TaxID=1386 RepID=UPI0002FD279B|nr:MULTISPECIES: penicillin-binding transpeptidase domain-containing protein [Bacillus]